MGALEEPGRKHGIPVPSGKGEISMVNLYKTDPLLPADFLISFLLYSFDLRNGCAIISMYNENYTCMRR